MTTHLVTFSDESMSRARGLCISSFKRHAESLFVSYSTPELLRDTEFYSANKALLDQPRGCGYWAWKPYVIDSCLNHEVWEGVRHLHDGDILIYSDAGVEFIAPVQHIIDRMDQDVWLFSNNWEHAHWCKRDVVEVVWPFEFLGVLPKDHQYIQEKTWDRFGKQVQASVIFFRVSDYSRAFVAEWLKWCLFDGGRLIDDSPSRAPNHPEFREHRHDQAILTTMAYREGIRLHYWPAMYNDGAFTYEKLLEYADDNYPVLFHHHRRRDHEWK